MSTYATFNLNEYLLVKLRPDGFKLWQQFNNRYLPPHMQQPLAHFEKQANEAGYVKFQAWNFMQVFGPVLTMGMQTVFETDVLISKSDLKN